MEKKQKRHVVISGVGRSGTTFLIHLMTQLGLKTGFRADGVTRHINKASNAGLEKNVRSPKAPYIVKDPIMCDYIDEIVESDNIILEHVYVPMRTLSDAAQSRVNISKKGEGKPIPGGMWKTADPDKQEGMLAAQLYKLLVGLGKIDVPVTFLHFPTIVQDPEYLYQKLSYVLSEVNYDQFLDAFNAVADPSKTFSS